MRFNILSQACLPIILFSADDGTGAGAVVQRPGDSVAVLDSNGNVKTVVDATGNTSVVTTPVTTEDLFAALKARCEIGVMSGNAYVANEANNLLILIHAIEAIASGGAVGNGVSQSDFNALTARVDTIAADVANLDAAGTFGKPDAVSVKA